MDNKKKSDIYLTVFLVVAIIGCIALSGLIYIIDYMTITKPILGVFILLLIAVGIFQLCFNKINYKFIQGRSWGIAFVVSGIFLCFVNVVNGLNERVTIAFNYDKEKISEYKTQLNHSDEDIKYMNDLYNMNKFESMIKGLKPEKIDNITYHYDNENSRESIKLVDPAIKDFHSKINELFKLSDNVEGEIAILESLSTAEMYDEGVAAFVNGGNNKIYLRSKFSYENLSDYDKEFYLEAFGKIPMASDEEYIAVVLHEYTHKLTNDIAYKNNLNTYYLPTWIYEGLATYTEYKYHNKEIPTTEIDLSKTDIRNNSNFWGYGATVYYEKSCIYINRLIERYGQDIIVKLFENMSTGNDIYQAIKEETGMSFEKNMK